MDEVRAERDAYVAQVIHIQQSGSPDIKGSPEIKWPILVNPPPDVAANYQERSELAEAFKQSSSVVVVPVLTGMGGVGKTQLAAHFAQAQWRAELVHLLVWVNASSRESIINTYVEAAERIGVITAGGGSEPLVAAKRFRSWLGEPHDKEWLVVLDDVADLEYLEDLRPPLNDWGKTIVTTTQRQESYFSGGWKPVDVGLFTDKQAREYLRDRLGDREDALSEVDDLARDLGYLPLALATAVAYILAEESTCAEYRRLLADYGLGFVKTRGIDGYKRAMATTWLISIERVSQQIGSDIARRLIEMMSLLDPNGIPIAIIEAPSVLDYLGNPSSREVEVALRALRRFSLLTEFKRGDHPVRIHALVQWAVREAAEKSLLTDATRALADSIESLWKAQRRDTNFFGYLQSNATALCEESRRPLLVPRPHQLLFRLGDSYGEAGQTWQAHEYFTDLRDQAAAELGTDSRDTFKARERAAYWLGFGGKAGLALEEFESLTADEERVLGRDDPDTFIARHNAARFRGRNGDATGAVENLRLLVADEIRVLGRTDIQTLESRGILGYWLNRAGDHDGAVTYLTDVIADLTEHHQADHPLTLTARNDRADALAAGGKYDRAITEGEAVVRDRARVLGAENIATLTSQANLARWRAMSDDYARGLSDLAASVVIHQDLLGNRHPNTLRVRAYHIEAVAGSGDVTGAIAAMTEHLPLVEDVHGPKYILTTRCRENLEQWRRTS